MEDGYILGTRMDVDVQNKIEPMIVAIGCLQSILF